METLEQLENKPWWGYLGEDLQKLIKASEFIYKEVKGWGADLPGGRHEFNDYSFVVFPAAKAYEGFLKKLFFGYEIHYTRRLLRETLEGGKSSKPIFREGTKG